MSEANLQRLFLIRGLLVGVILGLVASGVTAFPLPSEVRFLCQTLRIEPNAHAESLEGLTAWLVRVRDALNVQESAYPFLFYGTDWLAFAHLVIALLFVGPIKDPVRNKWVIQWGVLACILVLPLALICGPIRGIPWQWQLIDCSFGIVGVVPLLLCLKYVRQMEGP